MPELFQRLLYQGDDTIRPLSAQAALGAVREPERSQIAHLVRLFLERFFNHETASPDGDGKARLVLIACTAGLPPFLVAMYLWPVYHPLLGWPPGHKPAVLPSYWQQANHHFFFVMYSLVAVGIATLFEWDLFFPDLLDVYVLGALPIPGMRSFLARMAAIGIFIAGFLFDANFLAPIVLPMSTDPPRLFPLVAGHVAAVAASGLFGAVSIVAVQAVLLSLLGERQFRRVSLALQGLAVAALVTLMLLFPVLSGITPSLLKAAPSYVLFFPPFWFLGIYQRILDGPGALPIWNRLALFGCLGTLLAVATALVFYPRAYVRRTRALVEGTVSRMGNLPFRRPANGLLHALVRSPQRRAIFHFITQTLLRVPRYRIYLVLYGGVGLSVAVATILRFHAAGARVRVEEDAVGMRVATSIIAFWVVAGLRSAFVSSGNEKGSWILRVIHGKPATHAAAVEEFAAARVWATLCAALLTFASMMLMRLVAPPELLSRTATLAQFTVAAGVCVLFTDAAFLNVTTVAFTGGAAQETSNLAFTVLRYYTLFPLVTGASVVAELWAERSLAHSGMLLLVIVVAHLWLGRQHRSLVRVYAEQLDQEEGEEDFPMKLGLRY